MSDNKPSAPPVFILASGRPRIKNGMLNRGTSPAGRSTRCTVALYWFRGRGCPAYDQRWTDGLQTHSGQLLDHELWSRNRAISSVAKCNHIHSKPVNRLARPVWIYGDSIFTDCPFAHSANLASSSGSRMTSNMVSPDVTEASMHNT